MINVNRISDMYRNVMWGQRHFKDFEIYNNFEYTSDDHHFEIIAQFNYFFLHYDVTIQGDDDRVKFSCDCDFNKPHSACGHVVATALLYNELRFDKKYETFSSVQFEDYRQEILNRARLDAEASKQLAIYNEQRKNSETLLNIMNQKELLKIDHFLNQSEYTLHFDFELIKHNKNHYASFKDLQFYLKAKVGNDKMYVIKDFEQFFDLISHEEYFKYGQNLGFVHSLNAFDASSQHIIVALQQYFLNVQDTTHNFRTLAFEVEHLDFLYDLFKDPSVVSNVQFKEAAYTSTFQSERINEDEVRIRLLNTDDLYTSAFHLYHLSNNTITRYHFKDVHSFQLVKLLLEHKAIILKNAEMDQIVSLLNKDATTILDYTREETVTEEIALYIDLNNENIVVHGDVIINDEHENILLSKYQTHLNVQKIIHILSSFETGRTTKHIEMALSNPKTYTFLAEGLDFLQQFATVYAHESLKNINQPSIINLNVGVSINHNLLDLDVSSLNFSKSELVDILKQYRRKQRFFKLKSGEIINLESEGLDELDRFIQNTGIKVDQLKDDTITLPLYQAMHVEHDLEKLSNLNSHLTDDFKIFSADFKQQKVEHMDVSKKYLDVLKPYQVHGVKWLKLLGAYGFNGILADDMGLGKTLQIIALLENSTSDLPSLVVAPASLLFNWDDELKKFDSNLKTLLIHGPKEARLNSISNIEDYDIIITTYDYLRNDFEAYQALQFHYLIIDEAQYIKNQKTQTARSVKTIKSEHRLALTGTPIENTLAELWSIFDFLMPGYLYNYNYFKSHFEIPIVQEQDAYIQDQLKAMVSPFILRRIKQDVLLDLPDKIEKTLSLEFSEDEAKLYYAKLAQGSKQLTSILEAERVDNIMVLQLLNELRQICIDPRLLYDDIETPSSKIKATIEILEPLVSSKQKTLIFSSFTRSLSLLEKELKAEGISYFKLTGANSKEERRQLVDAFQNDDTLVFLISLKAAGVGLNLTAAENVIHFDPWWNVAAENQASDRAYRIGQTKEVQVIKLIMKDSIEEKILAMQAHKKAMADIFIEGSSGSFASMSKEDLKALFEY